MAAAVVDADAVAAPASAIKVVVFEFVAAAAVEMVAAVAALLPLDVESSNKTNMDVQTKKITGNLFYGPALYIYT